MTIRPLLERTPEEKRKMQMIYSNRYQYKHKKSYRLSVSKKYERDIIKWLEANRPYQTAVKTLIREQIKREKLEKKKKSPD